MWANILNLDRAAHVSLNYYESYQQIPEKTKNNGENERQYWYFSLLSSFTNATDLYPG